MQEMPHSALLRSTLEPSLEKNLKTFKTIFHAPANQDLVTREFETCGFSVSLVYLEGMAGGKLLNDGVLRPGMEAEEPGELKSDDRADYLTENVLNISQTKQSDVVSELVESVLDGNTVLLIDGCTQAVILETRNYEKRNVDRTVTESVLVGPQQGFVENLRTNITLVRRMIHSPFLITEMIDVGARIPTKISLLYLEGVVDERALKEIRRRIRSLNVDYVANTGNLQELLEDSQLFMLPQMLQTERPDRVTPALLDGQIAILMDNSPYALIAPITFFHLFHATDDNYMRWQYGTFIRILRLLGMAISLLLPGVYVAITLYHSQMIPLSLLTSIAETRARVPFPVIMEVLFMELSFALINEAGSRLPNQIGSALGIVGALILGQSAVAADIISPVLIIVVALTGLGNYAAPIFSLTIAFNILRFGVLFAGTVFGLYGVVLIVFLYLCVMCGARSMGAPMMTPISPRRPHNPDLILRLPTSFQKMVLSFANENSWLNRTLGQKKMRGWEDTEP